jgi:hypothetical protein
MRWISCTALQKPKDGQLCLLRFPPYADEPKYSYRVARYVEEEFICEMTRVDRDDIKFVFNSGPEVHWTGLQE